MFRDVFRREHDGRAVAGVAVGPDSGSPAFASHLGKQIPGTELFEDRENFAGIIGKVADGLIAQEGAAQIQNDFEQACGIELIDVRIDGRAVSVEINCARVLQPFRDYEVVGRLDSPGTLTEGGCRSAEGESGGHVLHKCPALHERELVLIYHITNDQSRIGMQALNMVMY